MTSKYNNHAERGNKDASLMGLIQSQYPKHKFSFKEKFEFIIKKRPSLDFIILPKY